MGKVGVGVLNTAESSKENLIDRMKGLLSGFYRTCYRIRIRKLIDRAYKDHRIDEKWKDLLSFAGKDKPSEHTYLVINGFLDAGIERVKRGIHSDDKDDITVICVEKNSMTYLPAFLSYYRRIGIKQFLFIDNGSTDDTFEYLKGEEDVTLYSSRNPFDSYVKVGWILRAVQAEGLDRWYLRADMDEFLTWEGMEDSSVQELLSRMKQRGMASIRVIMTDMYPAGGLMDPLSGEKSFLDEYVYFDNGSSYNYDARKDRIFGGMRSRTTGAYLRMDKYIFFRPADGQIPVNNHDLTGIGKEDERICRGVLRHFKFLPSERDRIAYLANEKNSGYSNYKEIKKYGSILDGSVQAKTSSSIRYNSSKDLRGLDFIVPL